MNKLKILIMTVIVSFLLSLLMIQLISKKTTKSIYNYTSIEAKRFGMFVINKSIDDEFLNRIDQNIFTTTKNSNNEIQIIDFNTKKVNKILEQVTKKIQKNLINLENGNIDNIDLSNTFKGMNFQYIKHGIVCELPAGIIFSSYLQANNGPIIPVKLNFIGQVSVNLKTNVKTYGINNAYIEVLIHIEIEEQVSMPLQSKNVKVENDIPLTMKVIQGKVPNYYPSTIEENSKIFSLPVE